MTMNATVGDGMARRFSAVLIPAVLLSLGLVGCTSPSADPSDPASPTATPTPLPVVSAVEVRHGGETYQDGVIPNSLVEYWFCVSDGIRIAPDEDGLWPNKADLTLEIVSFDGDPDNWRDSPLSRWEQDEPPEQPGGETPGQPVDETPEPKYNVAEPDCSNLGLPPDTSAGFGGAYHLTQVDLDQLPARDGFFDLTVVGVSSSPTGTVRSEPVTISLPIADVTLDATATVIPLAPETAGLPASAGPGRHGLELVDAAITGLNVDPFAVSGTAELTVRNTGGSERCGLQFLLYVHDETELRLDQLASSNVFDGPTCLGSGRKATWTATFDYSYRPGTVRLFVAQHNESSTPELGLDLSGEAAVLPLDLTIDVKN